MFDEKRVQEFQTPQALETDENDTVDVVVEQSGGHWNSRSTDVDSLVDKPDNGQAVSCLLQLFYNYN